ncbi:MAG: hypothetical protein IJ837_02295 [Clostridia bacterium]|nr:hypothetical protein [Clostridia bacterium]
MNTVAKKSTCIVAIILAFCLMVGGIFLIIRSNIKDSNVVADNVNPIEVAANTNFGVAVATREATIDNHKVKISVEIRYLNDDAVKKLQKKKSIELNETVFYYTEQDETKEVHINYENEVKEVGEHIIITEVPNTFKVTVTITVEE